MGEKNCEEVCISGILVLVIVLAVFILFLVLIFNKIVVLKNRADNAWHQIAVQLKRRLI
ncbi:hypothetical protein B9J78_06465 [bacterium Unc6]|nr:hypothetical protein [bacterium Unc6]